ncbi:hypothetical protein QR680_016336 [Steinernema hermaphroditum]|uniref:Uncharacterized protein n=1 Tax=Steinernema hermaphroditum TaxID=289476 RepID=A0AA39HAW8_9BILA|nr:hypothetical protein QR680_016336 [Steinernema hermaphroditum]
MDLYLLHREKFNRLYNCDYLNQTEWENYAVQRPVMGWSTYVPCLIVMSGPSFFKSSCYKIMFFLGIIDIICIWVNCFTTGFLMIHGSVYCMFPNLEFVAGAIAIGGWSGQCISCAILAINRCIDLWSAYWSEVLFSGRRTYIWISIAWIYMLYFFFFTNAVVYTSSAIMWFFDPYLTVPQDLINVDREQYRNWQHSANDYSLVSVMFVLYAFLIVSIRIKSGSITKNQIKANSPNTMWTDSSIGYVYLALGVVYIIPAFICVTVILQPPLIYNSSYKMLCFISLMDILNIVACCFFAGVYSITGADYRNTPSMLTVGSVTLACWVSYCAINVSLATDRLFCFCSARWYQMLFAGKRAFGWIGVAILAGAQMMVPFDGEQFYHYDSSIGGWRFELNPRGRFQKNYRHMLINIGTFLILVLLYSSIVVATCRKSKQDKLQRQAAFQSAAICGFAMGADIFCIIVQNIENPSIAMCYIANFAWQLAHGGTGYACIIMNKTIREATYKRLCKILRICGLQKHHVTTVVTMNQTS